MEETLAFGIDLEHLLFHLAGSSLLAGLLSRDFVAVPVTVSPSFHHSEVLR